MIFKENKAVTFIVNRFWQNGFQAYIAGGAVRDILQKKIPDDIDILTNASIEEIIEIFQDKNPKKVGKAFPICMVNGIEVSSGRAKFNPSDFPESDLAQRDFTINSMAFDPKAGKIIDPFNGRKDLEQGIIRFTKDPDKRILEDPVRMIRACRFSALIEGRFSVSTLRSMMNCNRLLDEVFAKERLLHEIYKGMALKRPSLFFKALRKAGLLCKIFPSLDRCHDLDGGPHHGETVFEHCMMVGDALPAALPALRLAGFLHDAGKFDAAKIEKGHLTFAKHEHHIKAVVNDLETLRFPVREIFYISSIMKVHMRPLSDQTTPKAARRLLAMLDAASLDYKDFMQMRIADRKGNLKKPPYTFGEIRTRLKKLFLEMRPDPVFRMAHLKITGDDIIQILGIRPGPDVGKIKKMLFEMVLDDPEKNTKNELKKICLSLPMKNNLRVNQTKRYSNG